MAVSPVEVTLELTPRARFDIIDVRARLRAVHGGLLDDYSHHLYHSFHTTAGYLEQSLASRLTRETDTVAPYVEVFRAMFPEGAGYEHDKIDRRTELTEAQKPEEPRNADSHLAFMAGALRTCVAYRNIPNEPVCFIDLDGVHDGKPRKRRTSVLGYSNEEPVAQARIVVPVSRHAVDSVNLKNPRLGIYEECQQLVAQHGVQKGRIRIGCRIAERLDREQPVADQTAAVIGELAIIVYTQLSSELQVGVNGVSRETVPVGDRCQQSELDRWTVRVHERHGHENCREQRSD